MVKSFDDLASAAKDGWSDKAFRVYEAAAGPGTADGRRAWRNPAAQH